jgi:hypothetical protein
MPRGQRPGGQCRAWIRCRSRARTRAAWLSPAALLDRSPVTWGFSVDRCWQPLTDCGRPADFLRTDATSRRPTGQTASSTAPPGRRRRPVREHLGGPGPPESRRPGGQPIRRCVAAALVAPSLYGTSIVKSISLTAIGAPPGGTRYVLTMISSNGASHVPVGFRSIRASGTLPTGNDDSFGEAIGAS